MGPPDHESLLVLFWSHFKSVIEHFTLNQKGGFRPCFYGLHGGWRRKTGLSPPVKIIFTGRSKVVLLLCYSCLVFVMLLRVCFWCLVVTCWERADLLALVCDVLLCVCHFPMWYPGSGVVLDCIDSWSLPSFLLFLVDHTFIWFAHFIDNLYHVLPQIVFSAYVSMDDDNDIVNIKATTCNCIIVHT